MNKKRVLIIGLILILTVSMAFAGCGSSDSGSDGDSNTDGDKAAGETITLKVNNFMPQEVPPSLGTAKAGEVLAELSGGTIKTEEYYNGTLLGFNDSWQGTGDGGVDIAIMAIATIDQNTVLNNVFSTPVAGLNTDQVKTTQMFNELIDKEPTLNEELETKNLHWLSLQAMPNLNIHVTKDAPKTIADVKGKKIEGLGAVSSKYWEKLGATTVSLDPGDYFTSCKNGVVDGMFAHWACVNDYGLNDVLHAHTTFGEYTDEYPSGNGISTGCMGYAMNLDKWNSLSAEQQGWVTEAFRQGALYSAELDTTSAQEGYSKAVANGDEIVNIKGDDLAPWIDAMQGVVDEWIVASEGAGFTTATQIRGTLLDLVEEYKTK
ncbi:MAG: TRAP transporter substrate-binding protein DctP [Clostridiales Family XIII bacterium]|jgi:TRAP-type C4-dicarboxylate transport system substrate-binding protein|nr:TRAP transporter substrate-binding protein DctP [Clostridiales Family XIII bacterium]